MAYSCSWCYEEGLTDFTSLRLETKRQNPNKERGQAIHARLCDECADAVFMTRVIRQNRGRIGQATTQG